MMQMQSECYHVAISCEKCKYKNYRLNEYPCRECCPEDDRFELDIEPKEFDK